MTTQRKPPEARMCDEGQIIVRGVDTFEAAVEQAITDLIWDGLEYLLAELDDELDSLVYDDTSDDKDAHVVARARVVLTERYEAGRIGWFRYNPCNASMCCDHDSGWHLAARYGAGRGNWHGVLLERKPRTVTP